MAIRMKVNGEERVFEIDPDTPLLWALRDDLRPGGVAGSQ